MSDSIQTTLLALEDVQGIQGSFVLNGDGALLAMEMPALFNASMFAELGPRIGRLAECFASLGEELETCLIRYSDHLLCIKQFPKGGALCILTTRGVNLPALKMAINLAYRRVASEIGSVQPLVVPAGRPSVAAPSSSSASSNGSRAASPASATPAESNGSGPPVRKVAHYYRGQLVED